MDLVTGIGGAPLTHEQHGFLCTLAGVQAGIFLLDACHVNVDSDRHFGLQILPIRDRGPR